MTSALPIVNRVGDYGTVAYAAEVTGISDRTIERAIARGDVHAVRLGGKQVLVSLPSARAYKPRRKVTRRNGDESSEQRQHAGAGEGA